MVEEGTDSIGGYEMSVLCGYMFCIYCDITWRYLVTARQAAEEEGVTRKRLATKQYQGSVFYGVRSQAI
jgi:hypothetical protein